MEPERVSQQCLSPGCGSSGVIMPLATSRILAVLMFFLWATSCVDEPVTVKLERDREELGQGSTDSVPQVQRNEATTQNVSVRIEAGAKSGLIHGANGRDYLLSVRHIDPQI